MQRDVLARGRIYPVYSFEGHNAHRRTRIEAHQEQLDRRQHSAAKACKYNARQWASTRLISAVMDGRYLHIDMT
jgi:hypothetical protein